MGLDVEAVAFDIDGTLYPEWQFYILVFPFVLTHFSLMNAFRKVRHDIREYQANYPDKKQDDFFEFQAELLSRRLKKDKDILKQKLKVNIYDGWKPLFSKIKPHKYAVEVITELKNKGFKIALLSDFLTEQKGDVWGILPYCDVSMSSENVGALKPSQFPFIALSNELNVPCEKILYVGNSINYDAKGAKSVGMKTALIQNKWLSTFKAKSDNVDILFYDYRQLLKALL
ncbi:MAG: HAD family hydrolase [Treponema sp.]